MVQIWIGTATSGDAFAIEPMSRAAARGYKYRELLSQLESSIQLKREEKSVQMLMNPLAKSASRNGSDAKPTFFKASESME